jgi:hypothetical protein
LTVVGRLDQRKGKIEERALVVGQVVCGDWRTGARRGVSPDRGMDVFGNEIVSQPAEIAGAGTGGK